MDRIRSHPDWVIALIFAILAIIYSFSTPVFEASDEIFHYPVVNHIASSGTLPVQDPTIETMWEQEGSQPPLYYMLAAALTFPIDTDDLESVRWLNPHAKLGIPLESDNKNMVIHQPTETFPWVGTVLAVHLIRLFSIGLGAATVILTYRVAKEGFPARPGAWALAACLAAFNPMFLFISASVNNDNLAILLATWILYLLIRIMRDGHSAKRSVTLAMLLALATLTKISGLTLIPITGIVVLFDGWRSGNWRQAIAVLTMIAVTWIVIAGWWYLRNIRLYGELLGLDTMVAVAGPRDITLWELRKEWHGFWLAYWGLFGAVNILLPTGFYGLYTTASLLGVMGIILYLWKQSSEQDRRTDFLIGFGALVQVGIVFAGVIRWTSTTFASQGRLMFPVISLVSSLVAVGLVEIFPKSYRKLGATVSGSALLTFAILAPILSILPAYDRVKVVEAIPEHVRIIKYDYRGLELLGVAVDEETRRVDDQIPVTVYWRAAERMDEDLSLFLHATGRGNEQIGKIDSYPAGGALPTSLMEPGVIYEDRYFIPLAADAELPTLVRLETGVGTLIESGYEVISAVNELDDEVSNPFHEAGVSYPQQQAACHSEISGSSTLRGRIDDIGQVWITETEYIAAPGDAVEIHLIWESWTASNRSLTAFVHLVGSNPQPLAQADGPPLLGAYPTNWWTIPCEVADTRIIQIPEDLPDGTYEVLIGLYDPEDPALTRVTLFDPGGTPYPNDAALAATIQVGSP